MSGLEKTWAFTDEEDTVSVTMPGMHDDRDYVPMSMTGVVDDGIETKTVRVLIEPGMAREFAQKIMAVAGAIDPEGAE